MTLSGSDSQAPSFAANAVDISEEGLALAMTPEIEVGRQVLVSFELDGHRYRRLPAVVLRHDSEFGVGALRFQSWPDSARRSLISFLEH